MNILITGAGSGIGYETALKLAENEDNTVFAVSRKQEALDILINENNKKLNSGKIVPIEFSLESTDPSALVKVVTDTGHLDVLINNAGMLVAKSFADLSDEDWEEIFRVNLFGGVRLIRNLLPCMGGKKPSHIVNIGSMGGFQGSTKFDGMSAYSASKAAIVNLTESLAYEFRDRNISVNCIAPGAVQTKMLESWFPGFKAPIAPDDFADFTAWFAVNGHRFFNGKVLPAAVSTP